MASHRHIGTARQLEILLAVAEFGSISDASEALFLTQPTVSMQLKKLAETVGMPLYDQIGRKIVFTAAGEEMLRSARDIMGSYDRLNMALADLRGVKSGVLQLAVVTTSKYFMPHLLAPFCEVYPDIEVRLKVGNRSQIIERLKQGEDDFYVFSHLPEDVQTEHSMFLTNPLVAIAHEQHPLVGKKKVSLTEIAKEPFIMREKGSGTRMAIEDVLRDKSIQLNVKMMIESNEAIKHCVMAGLGISILSAHSLAYGGNSGLQQINVAGLPIKTHWNFAWLKAKSQSVVAKAFIDYVLCEGRELVLSELRRTGFSNEDLR